VVDVVGVSVTFSGLVDTSTWSEDEATICTFLCLFLAAVFGESFDGSGLGVVEAAKFSAVDTSMVGTFLDPLVSLLALSELGILFKWFPF
jgi:hypothetical protein